MEIALIVLIGWVMCSVATYFVLKCIIKNECKLQWTRRDRKFAIILSLGGPYSLFISPLSLIDAFGKN